MHIEYDIEDKYENKITNFQLLTDLIDHYVLNSSESKRVRLENQPTKVCNLFAEVIVKLMEKGIFTVEDLYDIGIINSWDHPNAKIRKEKS